MSLRNAETKGLVLFNRHYREKDLLVKIFTESFGKRMFFVKNADKSKISSMVQSFTAADFLVTINNDGFSFINDVSEVTQFATIMEDLDRNAFASVVISLADEAVEDGEYDPALYGFLLQTVKLMNTAESDAEILMDIFELQILSRFGVALNLSECAICGRSDLPMDYSTKINGCLCQDHFLEDSRRLHIDPNIIYLAGQFMSIELSQLGKTSVGAENKRKLQDFINVLYEEYVGYQTKAQRFLTSMENWGK